MSDAERSGPSGAPPAGGVPGGSGPVVTDLFARRTGGVLAFLVPHLRPGMRVLDGGCGPGSISADVARLVAPGTLVGVDLDATHLERARATAWERGVENVEFRQADLSHLPFDAAAFDAAYVSLVLEHLPDPVTALREVRRVLRSGGVVGVVTVDHTGILVWPPDPLVERWRTLHEAMRRRDGADNFLGRRLRAVLLEAGFARTEASATMECSGSADQLESFGEAVARMFTEGRWGRRYAEYGLADAAEVAELVAGVRAWVARPDAFYATPRCQALGWVDGHAPRTRAGST